MKIEMGMEYIRHGDKQKRVNTVIDCHKTYNLAGELVKTRYVSVHDCMGQPVYDYDVVQPTIARGLIKCK